MPNLPIDIDVINASVFTYPSNWTLTNYSVENYYGFSISLSSLTATNCQLNIIVYGFTLLSKLNVFFITWETSLTNTYTTRVVSGTSAVGCFYDSGGCTIPLKIKVSSNTTFTTSGTSINSFYDNMYFFGLNHFIIYH